MHLRLGERVLKFDRTIIMGILNTTPDSFSDGGRYLGLDDALQHASKLQSQGADIIDIGAESTRPGAAEVSLQEELDRAMPVIERIRACLDVAISIDSSKPQVMRSAVAAGASMINDVNALRADGALEAAVELDVAVCLMHMQGNPRTMQINPQYDDLIGEIRRFLRDRIQECEAAGIDADKIVVDPGFGFGKSHRHNLRILKNLDQFTELEKPILIGLSRKQTLRNLAGPHGDSLENAGIASAVLAVDRGASLIRTHDVASIADAVRIVDAVRQAEQDNV